MDKAWFLYVIECKNGSLYTGISCDVAKRYVQHCLGRGARYTKMHRPSRLIYQVEFPNRSEASRAEYDFKQMSAKQKHEWCTKMSQR